MIQDQLREIRRIHDIYDVLGLHRKSAKIVCPLPSHIHASNTPSFSIFIGADGVQRFQCHGNCGKRGDIIDLVGHMKIPAYDDKNPEDVKAAAGLLGSLVPVRVPERTVRQASLSPGAWRNYPLRREVIEYGRSRGLSPETLERHHVGQFSYIKDGEQRCFMSMPAFEDSVLKAIKFRNTRPAGPRF